VATGSSPVLALVVPTDEELMIARDTAGVIAADPHRRPSGMIS
jgi:acetate kinase